MSAIVPSNVRLHSGHFILTAARSNCDSRASAEFTPDSSLFHGLVGNFAGNSIDSEDEHRLRTLSISEPPLRTYSIADASLKVDYTLGRRSRSLAEPEPFFGLEPNQVQAPKDNVRLQWDKPPTNVLLICKLHDASSTQCLKDIASFLVHDMNANVLIEQSMADEVPYFPTKLKLIGRERKETRVDLIVCIGGDGTLLHACSLFGNGPVPPVICFHMGSLGFLMNFNVPDYRETIEKAMQSEYDIALRMRLRCQIVRNSAAADSDNRDDEVYTVINELVADRGPSPYLTSLELFCDGIYLTTLQADGIIIATPTGSTAYSLSAGGSMIHPTVPGILLTPICPHILASRPIVFPDYVEIKLKVPSDARGTAWAAFDGKDRLELKADDELVITMSEFPLPTFCKTNETVDWFNSLAECLHWNRRQKQKPSSSTSSLTSIVNESPSSANAPRLTCPKPPPKPSPSPS